MKCDEFWEKWADCFREQKQLDKDLKEHLKECSICSRELEILQQGFLEFKDEIEQEEGAHFWHEMRKNIRDRVRMPKKRFQWSFSWWNLGWATTGVVLVLFVLKTFVLHNPCLWEEDFLLLAGVDPINSVYVESEFTTDDQEGERLETDFYRGITESWASLLGEAFESNIESGEEQLPSGKDAGVRFIEPEKKRVG